MRSGLETFIPGNQPGVTERGAGVFPEVVVPGRSSAGGGPCLERLAPRFLGKRRQRVVRRGDKNYVALDILPSVEGLAADLSS